MSEQPLNLETIKAKLLEKSDEDLIEILSSKQNDYNVKVIPIIKNILIERGYSTEDLNGFDVKYLDNKNKFIQKAKQTSTLKVRYIFFGLILFGLGYYAVLLTNNSEQKNNLQSKDSIWSKSYENKVYQGIYKGADTLLRNKEQKQIFTGCVVEKLKVLLPAGIESIPLDSLIRLNSKIGFECASEIKGLQLSAWTPELEKSMKNSLMNLPLVKEIKADMREKFCDCYILKIKENYPEGLTGQVPAELQNRIGVECADEINKN